MPRHRGNSRGYSPRKINIRTIKQRFLIVCEGAKTEPNYFRAFRVPKDVAELKIKGIARQPSQIVVRAREIMENEDYDQVWCVFDRDDWTPEDFNNAITNAERSGIKVAYSNEAFELWYVLHFCFLNTGIPRSDYCKKLDKLLEHKYEKNSDTIYEELFDRQTTAIKDAENLLNQYQPPRPADDNPSTTVHLLVQELNKFL
ncbi:RloB family protein [Thermosynechococcaceae cyanobacterium BACA0444]|uniref:RloB family protein n=1 Tax=Pseudocalidococcus azoricus BACA0444 TaxID=2918990 RepID=A0AAE4FS85_9CYAN|nr:RloB family protein [Pseudocalidococcus azoricus]MDS3860372.1 RloB family protein [Pseudocalidococcus azoricus BACA0444]